jgi:hypothetical protein
MKLLLKCAVALTVVFYLSAFTILENRNVKQFSQLTFDNIEALADNEGDENFLCLGIGEVDCYGYKVICKITNFR